KSSRFICSRSSSGTGPAPAAGSLLLSPGLLNSKARMHRTVTKPTAPQLTITGGKLGIECPWDLASALQNQLQKRGIGATLPLDPVVGEARLALRGGVDTVMPVSC